MGNKVFPFFRFFIPREITQYYLFDTKQEISGGNKVKIKMSSHYSNCAEDLKNTMSMNNNIIKTDSADAHSAIAMIMSIRKSNSASACFFPETFVICYHYDVASTSVIKLYIKFGKPLAD